MSKKIHRYVRAVKPITQRFNCTLQQAGDYVEKLLSFERRNEQLSEELRELEIISKETITALQRKISELQTKITTE